MKHRLSKVLALVLILSLALPMAVSAGNLPAKLAAEGDINFTILHTNDFHGYLEYFDPAPGAARVATKVKEVRTAVGADNVLLMDAGDQMQGYILSNWFHGESTIDYFNTIGYDLATFGNHEFDWGQTVLGERVTQATYPYISANIVVKDTADCATSGWTTPALVDAPYQILEVGTSPNIVKVGVIAVTTMETPFITIAEATQGLCFKDPYESILHYYDTVKAASDVLVVLSHLGHVDQGTGYGLTFYGDQVLAGKLNTAGKPVNLIIGGHSHTNIGSAVTVGTTKVVTAHYNGRKLGRADISFNPTTKAVTVNWQRITIDVAAPTPPVTPDAEIATLISTWASEPGYYAVINEPIGWTQVDLSRNYNGDQMMGAFIQDAIYNQLNEGDTEPLNDVDMVFNNPGGIRVDLCAATPCVPGLLPEPRLLTYGMMYSIMPFGNLVTVGDMKGSQIIELFNQSATLFKGALQVGGVRYKFYRYSDALPGPQPYAWGAYDIEVLNKDTDVWEPIDPSKTYRIATNNFLAPAGQDGFTPFKYLTNISYWGDMLDVTNAWVKEAYPTQDVAFKGYTPEGGLDGRITRNGTDTFTGAATEVVPLTILHHNDSHGYLADSGTRPGYPRLVTLINQARAHNADRTLLLSSGDNIQGDAMMKFYMTAPQGYSVDGTALPVELQINPLIKAFNFVGYDAMTLGNHEYNFGSTVFTTTLKQADFPILQANVTEDISNPYGIAEVGVKPAEEIMVGPEQIKVAIIGIGNHRVPNYELPSNIPGLEFGDPLVTAQVWSDTLRPFNDVVIALTHIGFTEDPSSVEVDKNVDTNLASTVTGLDAIVGGHSHTSAINGYGPYKWLPTFVGAPDGTPVIISQAYRYNNTLGTIVLGLLPGSEPGDYEVVSRAGRYETVNISGSSMTPENAAVKALIQPYVDLLTAYQNIELGETIIPIDATKAFTEETNSANLQADSAVWKLEDEGIDVDFHLSGAMSNTKIAAAATPATPVMLKIKDMYDSMPYENSLVVLSMNGPQLKAVLERAYRNFYYYKYVPGYGGYSYYTTCMLDINALGQITYNDLYPAVYDPGQEYVVSLTFNGGQEVDFENADTYYNVSTVNYLAAGSCNFNDNGVSLWPLDQIVADTQYYVRDSVIDYIKFLVAETNEPINPVIEGRLQFIHDTDAPTITIASPVDEATYLHTALVPIDVTVEEVGPAGLKDVWMELDGVLLENEDEIDLHMLALGSHTFTVFAVDKASNESNASVNFTVEATIASLKSSLEWFWTEGMIDNDGVYKSLMVKLIQTDKNKNVDRTINVLEAFMNEVEAQSGKHITTEAANLLLADVQYVIAHLE